MPKTMDNLPVETVEGIFGFLSIPDLKSTRLVSKFCSSVAARHLFREVHVFPHPTSFQRLELLLRNPSITRWIESIHVASSMVQDPSDFSVDIDNQDFYWTSIRQQYQTHIVYEPELKKAYSTYQAYLGGQRAFKEEQMGAEILKRTFKLIPGLVGLKLADSFGQYDGFRPNYEGPFKNSSKFTDVIFPYLGICPDSNMGSCRDSVNELFRSMLLAAKDTDKKIATIVCNNLSWGFFDQDSNVMSDLMKVFAAARHVTLRLAEGNEVFLEDPSTLRSKRSNLAQLLDASSKLETFDVSFGSIKPPEDYDVTALANLLEFRSCWSELTILRLRGLTTQAATLKIFLGAHSSTLRSLDLADIKLDGNKDTGSWTSILEFLGQSLHLKDVRLDGYLKNWDESWESCDEDTARSYARPKDCKDFVYETRLSTASDRAFHC